MTVFVRTRRVGVLVAICVVAFGVVQYVSSARKRAAARECINVTSQSGLYRAESCVTDVNGNLVLFVGRLYDAHSGTLIARVDFDSMDGGAPQFMPDESAVLFRGAGDSGEIGIPPNWRDRLRASLP